MNERYRLVRPLASGGMAELFLGLSRGAEGFEKHVAIKRILPYLAKEEGIAKMFLSEAKLATHLHHQNLVSVYDVGTDADGLFLVMELVNGWDLGALIRRAKRQGTRFPPHLVAFIGAQALAGLIHAYRRTHNGRPVLTAHRDISPSNILVSREGEVKVTDFGIARLEGVSNGTQPGVFKGKPSYAAPEVVTGAPATAASDQFSLGIVLYELLTGQHPFSDSSEAIIVAMAIAQREPPPLTHVPEPLVEVVMRALAKQPEARFAQPEAMAEALARYLARAGEPATSHALADFLAKLNLPPTLLEQAEAAREPAAAQPPLAAAPRASPPAPPPAAPPPGIRGIEASAEWSLAPGSRELSMSGRLISPPSPVVPVDTQPGANALPSLELDLSGQGVNGPSEDVSAEPALARTYPGVAAHPAQEPAPSFRCVRCDSPLPSAYAPCDRCAANLTSQGPAPLAAAPLSAVEIPEEKLELQERAARQETLWEPDRRSPWVRWALRLGVLGVLVAGGYYALPHLKVLLPSAENMVRTTLSTTPAELPPLIVRSQPEGAQVRVNGEDKGTTPLLMDNVYPAGADIPVQVSLPGYKPWKGTFTGGAPAHFDVKLQKQR
ncbi:serine/threonine-protein kinase [Hyalangium rubrum]|uniref:non-specific serine/threonine protein kinase n=1 Tax=Hyalangium rubrum TaxID=3103134 RepID=A0ABU5H5J5_9BACT|nr:protein kinase [Hyalangium sp. s54d21]MDY7228755.1 protein kinase [Hyalangium sp. s54d21]